jgi:hypothetical protein
MMDIATAARATFLGAAPITVGATPEHKKYWMSKIADQALLGAYSAMEPPQCAHHVHLRRHARNHGMDGCA